MIYWPIDPPDDAVALVRVTGTALIAKTRKVLREADISFTMGGTRKDDVTFYVPETRQSEAKKILRGTE